MKRSTFAFSLLFLLLAAPVFGQGTKSNPARPPVEKIDAQALLNEIVGRAPTEVSEVYGTLKIRGADGSLRKIPIKWSTKPLTNGWFDMYQTPSDMALPQETLIITHREGEPNRYDFRREGAPVPGASTNIFAPFATSDFWLADFGLEFLHWPNPVHLDTEMRKGRACRVIESANPGSQKTPYARVLSWIDVETGGLIRAEAFDGRDKLLKEFTISDIKKVEGRWRIKELEIRNDQTDTNTRLEFDLEVADGR